MPRERTHYDGCWRSHDECRPPETRVVLVKPGDVLVFGNIGRLDRALDGDGQNGDG